MGGAAGLAALVLCSLWGWSYLNNRATLASIADELAQAKADDQAASGQYTAWRSLDRLRFWAAHYHEQHHAKGVPLSMRLGLYQGHEVEPLLRNRYFAMLQNVMLKPTADNLTRTLYLLTTLKVYQRNTRELQPVSGIDSVEAEALPHDNRAQTIANFGKAALDTYVMLSPGQREHATRRFSRRTCRTTGTRPSPAIPARAWPPLAARPVATRTTCMPAARSRSIATRSVSQMYRASSTTPS